jgi:hypothetical protein
MLDYLEKRLLGMPAKMRNHSMVEKMLSGLRKIRMSMENEDGVPSKQTVKEIGRICAELVALSSHRPA